MKSTKKDSIKKNRVDEFIKNPKKALFVLSLPIIVGMLVQSLYSIVDTAFVGRLGADAIAALTLSWPIFFILMALTGGLGVGMASCISRYLGAKKKKEAENTAMHGLMISLVLAAATIVIGLLSIKYFFPFFSEDANVIKLGIDYMTIVFISTFFMFPSFIMNNIFAAEGNTKTPMTINIISLAINSILDPILIYGAGLGVKGAAFATMIGFLSGVLMYLFAIRKKSYLQLNYNAFKYSPEIIMQIVRVGIPASMVMLLMSVYVIFLNKFMGYYGTLFVAAFGIATRVESIAITPVIGLGAGMVTLVGMFFGAKRFDLLKDIIYYTLKVGIAFTLAMAFIIFLLPEILFRIFTTEPELIAVASAYMRINVLTFPLMAIAMILSRSMHGMGFGMPGFMINLTRIVFIAVPLGYIFVYVLGWGYLWVAVAAVCGGTAASIVGFILLNLKFKELGISK